MTHLPRLTDAQLGYLLLLGEGPAAIPSSSGILEPLLALGFVSPGDGLAELTEAGRIHLLALVDPASGPLFLNIRPS